MAGKVLYISYDGMTDPLGQSQVIPYIQGLTKLGYHFTLVSFEKKERFKKLSGQIQSILDQSGIRWEPLFFTRRPPFVSKIYDVWNLKRSVRKLHRNEKFDFVHCRSFVPAAAGLDLWQKYRVPFLFDMRGFWVDERVDNGQWNLSNPFFKFFYKIYKKKEAVYFRESGHIISLTWKGRDELTGHYSVSTDKITVIPCCVDLDHFDYRKIDKKDIIAGRKKLGINDDETVLCYLGSLGGWYLVEEMIDFFVELKKIMPKAKFLFITQDPPGLIKNAVAERGVNKEDIIIQPALRNEVPLYLSLCDWSIFFIKDAYSKKASSPTKQGEIMAMGTPLICNDIGDTGKIIKVSGAGQLVNQFNQAEYQRVISNLITVGDIGKDKIRNASIEYYDLKKGVDQYQRVYHLMQRTGLN